MEEFGLLRKFYYSDRGMEPGLQVGFSWPPNTYAMAWMELTPRHTEGGLSEWSVAVGM
jgi:hypothetical protein